MLYSIVLLSIFLRRAIKFHQLSDFFLKESNVLANLIQFVWQIVLIFALGLIGQNIIYKSLESFF